MLTITISLYLHQKVINQTISWIYNDLAMASTRISYVGVDDIKGHNRIPAVRKGHNYPLQLHKTQDKAAQLNYLI
jgi:hypothetical protein